jgi:hypothetical protein
VKVYVIFERETKRPVGLTIDETLAKETKEQVLYDGEAEMYFYKEYEVNKGDEIYLVNGISRIGLKTL